MNLQYTKISFKNKKIKKNIFFMCFFILLIFLFVLILSNSGSNQFTELANSFINGKLYFLDDSVYNCYTSDNVLFNGHFYWPLGPFPAIILMPIMLLFSFLGLPIFFVQGCANFILIVLISLLIFKIAQKIGYNHDNSYYWIMAFIFASAFIGVAFIPFSWFFAHTVTVFLLFLSIFEYLNKKRPYLLGLLMGFILLTRVTAFFAILFFISDILFLDKDTNIKQKAKKILEISIFPFLCLLILFLYNYLRFGNIFDQGYIGQILTAGFMSDKVTYGLFNLKYLPRGIYYFLINIPNSVFNSETHLLVFPFIKPDPWGMSIFFTSPYLLYLFFLKNNDKKSWFLLLNSLLMFFIIASSFFIGYIQFGSRYSLDFFPLLFFALMLIYFKKNNGLKRNFKIIIILSALINLYLINFLHFV